MSIADRTVGCAKTFRELQNDLTEKDAQNDAEKQAYSDCIAKVNDSFERFQLWSSNLGAHRRDHNSLDQRLWEASHLRNRVLEYLDDLQQGVADVSAIIKGAREPWDELSDSSSEEVDLDDVEIATELEQLVAYISNTIGCLLRISLAIQKPAPHDRFIKSGQFDQSFRQPWDEQHVRDKFTDIPEWLIERLGKANSRRRQFLEYRKAHHERITRPEAFDTTEDTGTVVSSLPTAAKEHQGVRASVMPEILKPDDQSDAGISETSYAETIVGENSLFVPAMPGAAHNGAVFECPYCFMLISGIYTKLQWKRHVFTDLQPYICLFQDCVSADETFARRRKWIQHESHFHSKIWRCNFGCNQSFPLKNEMQNHITEAHGLSDHTETYLQALSIQVQREIPTQLSCPICNETASSLRRYHKHVAQHLEQLALFVIPSDNLEGENDEANVESDDDEDGEDRDSIASTGQASDREPVEDLHVQTGDGKNPDALDDMVRLAIEHEEKMQFDEAERVLLQALEVAKMAHGRDNPSTLEIFQRLGLVYRDQSKLSEAGEMFEKALKVSEKVSGRDHPDTLLILGDLGDAYEKQGKLAKAEIVLKRAVVGFEKVPGDDNVDKFDSFSELGNLYEKQGKLVEAEKMYQRALEGYKRMDYGKDRYVVNTLRDLGRSYAKLGRLAEAEKMYEQALEGCDEQYGYNKKKILHIELNELRDAMAAKERNVL